MSGQLQFSENFWGANGFEVIDKRLTQGSEASKFFTYFMEETSNVEENYSKGLRKILTNTSKLVEFGTMRECWLAIRGEIENQVTVHHERGSKLHMDIGIPLKKFRDDQAKLRKQYLGDAYKLNKERYTMESLIYRNKERYEKLVKDCEVQNGLIESATAQNKTPNEIQRLVKKGNQLTKDCEKEEKEYKVSVEKLTAFQPTWEEKLENIYSFLQKQEEDRIDFMKEQLSKYTEIIDGGQAIIQDSTKRMSTQISNINKKIDIEEFVRDNQTGNVRPGVPAFTAASSFSSAPAYTPSVSPVANTVAYTPPTSYEQSYDEAPVAVGSMACTALYDYVGADANEIDFFAGDTINVIAQDDSGWWTGEIDGRQGLFPSNYIQFN